MTEHGYKDGYVGKHRKPDTPDSAAQQPDDGTPQPAERLLRRTLDLFTHGTQPLHLKDK